MDSEMRLLLVSMNYAPELTGIGKYSGEMAAWLTQKGDLVRVVAAPPYYPGWKVMPGYRASRYSVEDIDGVRIYRCPLWIPGKITGLKRILCLISFWVSSFPVIVWTAFRWRPDVVMAIEPPLFTASSVLAAAFLGRSKSWLHVQDFEVDAAFDLGILRRQWLRRLVLRMESSLMRRFDIVSTISEKMLDKLVQKGLLLQSCLLFPNWVELDRIYPQPMPSPFRREWGYSDDDIVVLYSGNIGEKQGLEVVLDAAYGLRGKDKICFLICGDGAARARFEDAIKSCKNMRIRPLQPLERLNDLLNLADIHVLPQRADAEDLVLPSKLANMMASARPVVATARTGSQIASIVGKCGTVVEPGDVAALAEAICALAEDPARRKMLGEAGREIAIKNLDKENVLTAVFGRIKQSDLHL